MALFDDVSQLARQLQSQAFGSPAPQTQGYSPPQQNTLRLNFGAPQNQPAQTATDRQFHPQTQRTPQASPVPQPDFGPRPPAQRSGGVGPQVNLGNLTSRAFAQEGTLPETNLGIVRPTDPNDMRQLQEALRRNQNLLGGMGWQYGKAFSGTNRESQLQDVIANLEQRLRPMVPEDFQGPLWWYGRRGETRQLRQKQQQPAQKQAAQTSPVQSGPSRTFTPPSPQSGYTSSKDMRNIVSNLSKLTGGA